MIYYQKKFYAQTKYIYYDFLSDQYSRNRLTEHQAFLSPASCGWLFYEHTSGVHQILFITSQKNNFMGFFSSKYCYSSAYIAGKYLTK